VVAAAGALLTVRVNGVSMAPTLDDGDTVLVDKVGLHFQPPGRGDIVEVIQPNGVAAVKRVIGLPGDVLEIDPAHASPGDWAPHAAVLVKPGGRGAWQELEEPYVAPGWVRQARCCDDQGMDVVQGPRPVTLPPGQFFVLGDNRNGSKDSRAFGLVSRDRIVARVLVRYWPPDRAGPPAAGLRLVPA
jgi:signal peptidase I